MNWRTIGLSGVFIGMVVLAIWLAQHPPFGILIGIVVGVNTGLLVSRVLLFLPSAADLPTNRPPTPTAVEIVRLRALVEAAYQEGCSAGIASVRAAREPERFDHGWEQSRAREALRT